MIAKRTLQTLDIMVCQSPCEIWILAIGFLNSATNEVRLSATFSSHLDIDPTAGRDKCSQQATNIYCRFGQSPGLSKGKVRIRVKAEGK